MSSDADMDSICLLCQQLIISKSLETGYNFNCGYGIEMDECCHQRYHILCLFKVGLNCRITCPKCNYQCSNGFNRILYLDNFRIVKNIPITRLNWNLNHLMMSHPPTCNPNLYFMTYHNRCISLEFPCIEYQYIYDNNNDNQLGYFRLRLGRRYRFEIDQLQQQIRQLCLNVNLNRTIDIIKYHHNKAYLHIPAKIKMTTPQPNVRGLTHLWLIIRLNDQPYYQQLHSEISIIRSKFISFQNYKIWKNSQHYD